MITRLLTILLVLSCCGLAQAQAQTKKGAFFNPRISSRGIAFNQMVRVTFTTIPAQIPSIDIRTTVQSALDLPSAREHWRLFASPTVTTHERLKTIEISFTLQPRQAGDLALPDVPVRWLDGDQVASFGTVSVSNEILVGNQARPIPLELSAVAGFSWETPFAVLREKIGEKKMESLDNEQRHIFRPASTIEIECRSLLMHSVRLTSKGMLLADARPQFVNRWGEPIMDMSIAEPPHMTWVLGWLRITATQVQIGEQTGITIELLREDIAERILATQLEANVFNVLDGNAENAVKSSD